MREKGTITVENRARSSLVSLSTENCHLIKKSLIVLVFLCTLGVPVIDVEGSLSETKVVQVHGT